MKKFTKYPSMYVKASSGDDFSYQVVEDVKHALFDANDNPQPAGDGTEHNLTFVTWVGDSRSFIVNLDGEEYRVTVSKELY